jgi:DNA polymerase family A
MNEPQYIHHHGNKTYCHLVGELDRNSFSQQCQKCPLASRCTVKKEYLKNVAGDFHLLNAEGFFGSEFIDGDSDKRKELRAIAKIIGLSLTYGAWAGGVAERLNITQEAAQILINNFFRKLIILKIYMDRVQREALSTGQVQNLFFRLRDVSKDAFPDKTLPKSVVWKMQGYAKRTALNHPIQSTAADVLKLGSIRVDKYIRDNGLNPYAGDFLPQSYAPEDLPSYKDFKVANISSNHDELIYGIRDDCMDGVIPNLYVAMQEDDIMLIFSAGYRLELDCEYDATRSWTATSRFDGGKIYLLQMLQGLASVSGMPVVMNDPEEEPLTYALAPLEGFTDEVRSLIQVGLAAVKEHPEKFAEGGVYKLATISEDGNFYVCPPLPGSLIQGLNLPIVPAQFVRSEKYTQESERGF